MKKWIRTATTGMILLGSGSAALAAPQCVDRPSPPWCAADGYAYARPGLYGVYATRWRHWPTEPLASAPTPQYGPGNPAQMPPGINVIQLPDKQNEDRRAPPPTTPREEPLRTEPGANPNPNSPAGAGGHGAPGGNPAAAPGTGPATGPYFDPTNTPPESPRPRPGALQPYEPKAPTGPLGDSDPPPALPFGPKAAEVVTPVREAAKAPATIAPRPMPTPLQNNSPSDDPPPRLPPALAALSD
jgi:hypothetical protein